MSAKISSEEEFIQRTCVEHEDTQAKSFCAECEHYICDFCTNGKHRPHAVCSCDYVQTLQDSLKTFIARCDEQEEQSKLRQFNLNKNLQSIEKITDGDLQRLDQQVNQVKNQIETTYREERTLVEKKRKEQKMQLKNERSQLKKSYSRCEELHEKALVLLRQPVTSAFLDEALDFLQKNPLEDLPKESEVLDQLSYIFPVYAQIKDQKVLREYLKEQLLGSFVALREETSAHTVRQSDLRRSVWSLYQTEESVPKGKKQSVKSVLRRHTEHAFKDRGMQHRTPRRSLPPVNAAKGSSTTDKHSAKYFQSSPGPGIWRQQHSDIAFGKNIFNIDLHSFVDVKTIKGSPVKSVSNCIFDGDSTWVSSWTKDILGSISPVFFNITIPNYRLMTKKKKKLLGSCCPEFVFFSGDFIFFGEKWGNRIYQFNTASNKFKQVASFRFLRIDALCGNETYIYILNEEYIWIFYSNFDFNCKILSGLDQTKYCDIDMCLTTVSQDDTRQHTIAICTAHPASVRVVNEDGIIWLLDYHQCPRHFSPCSITSSTDGQIYIADRGTDKVGTKRYFEHYSKQPTLSK